SLDLGALGGQRWRSGWRLEIAYDDDEAAVLGVLDDAGATVAVPEPRRRLRVALRVLRRQITRDLDGEPIVIPLADAASFCYTRQSSALEATAPAPETAPELVPYAVPTQPEAAPWWEIDLGATQFVGWARIDIAAVPASVRIIVHAFGYHSPIGSVPVASE